MSKVPDKSAKRAGIYTRVSTTRQATEGLSLDAQDARCTAYVEREGWTLADRYVERGVSGRKADRPQLGRLMRDVADGALDVVVIPKIDRFGRSMTDLLNNLQVLKDHDVAVVFVDDKLDTSSRTGRLMLNILGSLAEFEADTISERVNESLAKRKAEGLHNGSYCYGFRPVAGSKGQRWEPNPAHHLVVRRVFDRHGAGISQRMISKELNDDGIRTQTGGTWSQGTISKMLKTAAYLGLGANGEPCKCGHPPLIDQAAWDRSQAIMAATVRHGRGGPGRRPAGNHILIQGLLRCGLCGSTMLARTDKRRGYESYFCSSQRDRGAKERHCAMTPWKREVIDTAILGAFTAMHLDVEAMRAQHAAAIERAVEEITSNRLSADHEAMRAEARKARVHDDYKEGLITAAEWRDLRAELDDELQAATARTVALAQREQEVRDAAAFDDAEERALRFLGRIRSAASTDLHDPEAVEALRAALLVLFEGFVLYAPDQPLPESLWEAGHVEAFSVSPTGACIVPKLRFDGVPLDPVSIDVPAGSQARDRGANIDAVPLP